MSAMEEDTLLDSNLETWKQNPVEMTTLMQAVSSKLDKLDSTSGILDAIERRLATLEDGCIISVNKRQVDSNESADSGPNGPKCSRSDTGVGRPQRYHYVSVESEL